jgi:hypothetical protein
MTDMNTNAVVGFTLCLVLVGAGCSDDDDHHHGDGHAHKHDGGGHNLNEEGCEHLEKGPFVDVTAGADAQGAVEVKADHQAYRVALTSGQAGFIKFAAAKKGDHVLFLDTDVSLEVQDDQGKPVTIENSEKGISECVVVKAKHTVELPGVGTYFFKLGPASAAQVTVVVEEASH